MHKKLQDVEHFKEFKQSEGALSPPDKEQLLPKLDSNSYRVSSPSSFALAEEAEISKRSTPPNFQNVPLVVIESFPEMKKLEVPQEATMSTQNGGLAAKSSGGKLKEPRDENYCTREERVTPPFKITDTGAASGAYPGIGTTMTEKDREFLDSPAAVAVRFMLSDVTDANLLAALEVIRAGHGSRDNAVIDVGSTQLLAALELIRESQGSFPGENKFETQSSDGTSFSAKTGDSQLQVPAEDRKCAADHHESAAVCSDLRGDRHNDVLLCEDSDSTRMTCHNDFAEQAALPSARKEDKAQMTSENDVMPKTKPTQEALVRYKLLLAENRRLKRRQFCLLCKTAHVNATLLPCGHFVYCLDCAQKLSHCGAYGKEIMGDVRTYLS